MFQNSFYSSPKITEEGHIVRKMMSTIKSPFLTNIEKAKNNLHTKREEHQIQTIIDNSKIPSRHIIQQPSLSAFSSFYPTERFMDIPPKIMTQSSYEEYIENAKEPQQKQWTMSKDPTSRFNKFQDMMQKYNLFFEEKVKFSKSKKYGGDSFKIEEKRVIEDIYRDLCHSQDGTVTFQAISDFFEKCPLFYRVYNIHPDSLRDVLSDSAHHFPSKLTEQQFMNLFLLNNRTNEDYDNYNVEQVFRRCVMDQQGWKQLKQIFEIFDTFGNETIQVRKFFHKLKISPQYKLLLEKEVIFFPNIKRHYTLGKILFELENKTDIIDKHCEWEQLKSMIQNFSHISFPSIDVLQKNKISNGVITPQSNSFMLKDSIINHLKDIFQRCPKYCSNFVKVAQFCSQVHEAPQTKTMLLQTVRKQPSIVMFKHVLVQLMNQPLAFVDLDQILEWFSIKGFNHANNQQTRPLRRSISIDSSDSDEEFNRKRRMVEKEKKMISNLPKKNPKAETRNEVTIPQQFKLSKKSKATIRQQKVRMMVEQQKQKQMAECSKKFKANPIPASINSQKYQEYRANLQANKETVLTRLNAAKEKDQLILQYLQANTRLFQKPRKGENSIVEEERVVRAEPAPWFVHVNLLEQIEKEKKERLKKARKESNYKYLKEWKNLPSFLYDNNVDSTPEITKAGSYNLIVTDLSSPNRHGNQQPEDGKQKKTKAVPNFKQLQQKFMQELQRKKKHYQPTIVKQFQLSTPRAKPQPSQTKQQPTSSRPCSAPKKSNKQNYIGSTLKYESMVRLNYERRVQEEVRKEEERLEEKARKQQKKAFAKIVQKQLKKQMKKQMKSTGMTAKSKRSYNNSASYRGETEMAEMYKRVFTRPFLFQQASSPKQPYSQRTAKAVDFSGSPLPSDHQQIEKLFPSEFMQADEMYPQQVYDCEEEGESYGCEAVESRRSI